MRDGVSSQIAELQEAHQGLLSISEYDGETKVSGSLSFEATADGLETITASFDIDLIIPADYPDGLPRVYEVSGKIDPEYEHVFEDKKLCLAVPIEERRLFAQEPTLLGFVNKLVVPYLYGYCYWEKHKDHPFDESAHGAEGIVQYYFDKLNLDDELTVLAIISYLVERGYRGHHPCPCGSGQRVRNCHGPALKNLNNFHTDKTLTNDFLAVLGTCLEGVKAEKYLFPDSLIRQVDRIIASRKL